MRTMRFIAVALPLLFAIASCDEAVKEPEQEEPEVLVPEIQLARTEVEIASDGAVVNLAYMVKNEIEGEKIAVSCEAEWLTVNTDKTRIITLSAETNETGAVREAEVLISYKDAEDVVLDVAQDFFINPLKIELSGVTATGVTFSVTTSDPDLTWIPMITYKEGYEYWDTADELFNSDMEYFRYLADINDQTLQEFLESMVAMGSLKDVYLDGLQPSTEYVLYAYGISTDGRRTTDIVAEPFTTDDPYEGDITFTFEVEENDYVLEYSIIPSHTGVPYYYGIVTEAQLDEWKAKYGNNIRTAIQKGEIDPSIEELMDYGMISGPSGYFDVFGESDIVDWGYFEMAANTKYILFAARWNEDCILTGPVSTYEHTSAAVEMSDNQITLEISNVTQSSADATATVTNDDPYVIIPVRTSEIEGLTDDEVFAYLEAGYDYIMSEYTFTGNKSRTYSRMRPDNEYTFFAFGYKAGTMTTDMIRKPIRTLPAGDPADCTFGFHVEPDVDNAWVEVTPSDKGQYYNWVVYPAYYTEEDAKNYIRMVIDQAYEGDMSSYASWELTLGDAATTVWDLYPETEYKVGAIIMDYDTGEFLSEMFFSEPFMTPAKTYAAITFDMDFGPYYDLGALVKAGQTQFEPLLKEGNALMPIKVKTIGECSAFYYDIYANDLSDEEMYTDETFYAALEGGGCPYESSIFVVQYDKPMTLAAVAYDYDGNPTKIYREVLRFSQDGASPVSEFIAQQQGKSSARSMCAQNELSEHMIPVGSKRHDAFHISEVEMQQRQAAARAKVAELRKDRLQKEFAEAKMRKSKMIAK